MACIPRNDRSASDRGPSLMPERTKKETGARRYTGLTVQAARPDTAGDPQPRKSYRM